jgi:hypothetical protein
MGGVASATVKAVVQLAVLPLTSAAVTVMA